MEDNRPSQANNIKASEGNNSTTDSPDICQDEEIQKGEAGAEKEIKENESQLELIKEVTIQSADLKIPTLNCTVPSKEQRPSLVSKVSFVGEHQISKVSSHRVPLIVINNPGVSTRPFTLTECDSQLEMLREVAIQSIDLNTAPCSNEQQNSISVVAKESFTKNKLESEVSSQRKPLVAISGPACSTPKTTQPVAKSNSKSEMLQDIALKSVYLSKECTSESQKLLSTKVSVIQDNQRARVHNSAGHFLIVHSPSSYVTKPITSQPKRTYSSLSSLISPTSLAPPPPAPPALYQPRSLFQQALEKINKSSINLPGAKPHSFVPVETAITPTLAAATDEPKSPELSPPDSLFSAPPSYSFVLRQSAARRRPRLMGTFIPSPSFVQRTPPPNYATAFDIYVDNPLPPQPPRVYSFGFAEMPIVCPECGYAGLTAVTSKVTVCTHMCAMLLCLFCCWVCAPLPYLLRSCKDVYHYCRNCRNFLGMYSPANPETPFPE